MRTLTHYSFFLLFSISQHPSFAQIITLHTHKVPDLIFPNNNYFISGDSEGFLWISSTKGLSRFDGIQTKNYSADNNDVFSLSENNIQSGFYEDENKNIWFSTTKSIQMYNRKKDHFLTYPLPNKNGGITHKIRFYDKKQQRLWVTNNEDLYSFSIHNPEDTIYLGRYKMNFKEGILSPPNSRKYFLPISKKGEIDIYTFEDQVVNSITFSRPNTNFQSNAYLFDEKYIWIGSDKGLHRIDYNESADILFTNFKVGNREITNISLIRPFKEKQLLVFSKDSGLFVFDTQTLSFIKELNYWRDNTALPFKDVQEIRWDQKSTLWIAQQNKGVVYSNLRKKRFNSILKGEIQSTIRAIEETSNGSVICTTDKELYEIDPKNRIIKNVFKYPPILGKKIYNLSTNPNGIFISSSKSIYFKSNQKNNLIRLTEDGKIVDDIFIDLYKTSERDIIVTTGKGRIYKIIETEDGNYELIKEERFGHFADGISLIYQQQDTMFFYEVVKGIHVFIKEKQGDWRKDTLLPLSADVNGILQDASSEFTWLASDAGLFKINYAHNTKSFELTKEENFSFRPLQGILQDTSGRLWISTIKGIVKYNPEQKQYYLFDETDGLQAKEFEANSTLLLKSGLFAFGGVSGVNVFDPFTIHTLEDTLNPKITNILVNDELDSIYNHLDDVQNISSLEKLNLNYKNNTLTFHCSAMECINPEANQFSFLLERQDEFIPWKPRKASKSFINNGTNRMRYSNIAPGKYKLYVKASNSDGLWSPAKEMLNLKIIPPWWLTRIAFVCYFCLLLAIMYAIYRYRVHQIQKQEIAKRKEAEFKQEIAEAKQAEAEAKQKEVELESSARILQMNPHIISNSMMEIKSVIKNGDTNTANKYLNRFASFMRKILDDSDNDEKNTDISTEIETLIAYLELSKIRFKELKYQFEVHPSINPENTLIPKMLLQPFVENSVIHGLQPKRGKGWIQVRFYPEAGQLICEIEDNGVGRKKIKPPELRKHKSKATPITRRRLELLKKETGQDASLKFLDLKDDKGNALGTKVRFQLPLF